MKEPEPSKSCRLLAPRRRVATCASRSRQLMPFKCPGGDTAVGPRQDQRPVNAAGRFSTKCATPSLKSSVLKLAAISRLPMLMASCRVFVPTAQP